MDFSSPMYLHAKSNCDKIKALAKYSPYVIIGIGNHKRQLSNTIWMPGILMSSIYVHQINLDKMKCKMQPSFQDMYERKGLIGHVDVKLEERTLNMVHSIINERTTKTSQANIDSVFFKKGNVLTVSDFYKNFERVNYHDVNARNHFQGHITGAYQQTQKLLEPGTPVIIEVNLSFVVTDDGTTIQRSQIVNIFVYK